MGQAQGWTVGPAPDTSAWTAGRAQDLKTTNPKDDSGNATADWMDRLISWIPAAGGAVGGVVGGIGGTVVGMGVGGPPGAIMGAALGGAAGEAYKELIQRARGRGSVPPDTSMAAAKNIGTQAAVQGVSQAVGEGLAPAMSAVGSRMMQSAVKPGLKTLLGSVKRGEAVPKVVQTLLDEGVNVTPGGVAKLQTLLAATNDEIATEVSTAFGRVSPLKVAGRLTETARTFANQANPQADLRAISKVGENFLNHPSMASATISVPEAQALKQGTYARIGEKYGQSSAAGIEAEKALARGLKEEIANEVPSVAALNAREGKLLEALDVVGKRVALAGNKDPIGFAWVAHSPMTFLAALIDRSPAVKSMLARGLYNSAGTAAKVSPQLIRVAVHALTSDDADAAMSGSSTDRGGQR